MAMVSSWLQNPNASIEKPRTERTILALKASVFLSTHINGCEFSFKMTAVISTNLTGLFPRNVSYVCKSRAPLSVSLSSSSKKQLDTNPMVFDFLLHKHQFSPTVASKAASVLTQLKDTRNADSILLFLKESGFSTTQLEKIVKYRPQHLSASLHANIKPKIKIFQDLGFSSNDIAKIFTSNPVLLQLNPDTRIIPALSVLKGLLGSYDDVAKLLRRYSGFLAQDLKATMVPNIEILERCGISMERIVRFLFNFPRLFLVKPRVIRKSIQKVEEMGVDRTSKMFIYAIRVIASLASKTWKFKLQAFRNFGFTEDEIMTMFRRAPQIFCGAIGKIRETIEVLLATGKYDLSCIANHPVSLTCSLEKKYKPRVQILGILESRNLIKNWPSLGTFYPMSDEKFFKKFVNPYINEVGEVYILWSSVKDKSEKSSVRGKKEKKNDLLNELG